jgi:2-polyprenyl-3-methyl-5-hydroxy-6-metoxy-1,4-benzoquinol methylase
MKGYAPEVVRVANATVRRFGAVNKSPIVYRFASKVLTPTDLVLDFGAGPEAIHAAKLRLNGFQVTSWDFGANFVEGVHDKKALSGKYDIVLASNVLNVLSDGSAITQAIGEMVGCLKPEGRVAWNYPVSPRKCENRSTQSIVAEFAERGYLTVSPHSRLFVSGIPAFLLEEEEETEETQ